MGFRFEIHIGQTRPLSQERREGRVIRYLFKQPFHEGRQCPLHQIRPASSAIGRYVRRVAQAPALIQARDLEDDDSFVQGSFLRVAHDMMRKRVRNRLTETPSPLALLRRVDMALLTIKARRRFGEMEITMTSVIKRDSARRAELELEWKSLDAHRRTIRIGVRGTLDSADWRSPANRVVNLDARDGNRCRLANAGANRWW